MKKLKERSLIRYVVKADGEKVDWSWNEEKAWEKAYRYAEPCWDQDIPYYPEMEVVSEPIE